MRCVVIESPFAGNIEKNLKYLRECIKDCLMRGEAPFASHALYTQPGVLNDDEPEERKLGIEAGFEIGRRMDTTVVYNDLGTSEEMKEGMLRASNEDRPVEVRSLTDWKKKGSYIKKPKVISHEEVMAKLRDADKNAEKFFKYANKLEVSGGWEEDTVTRYIQK